MRKSLKLILFFLVLCGCFTFGSLTDAQAATAKKVYMSKTYFTLNCGESYTLKVKNTSAKPKWSSTNTSIATVSSSGKVTAKKVEGSTTIKAKVGSTTYTCKVFVYPNKLRFSELQMAKNDVKKIRVSIYSEPTWKSSNNEIATVTSVGQVEAHKPGECTITATIKGKDYKCKVTVLSSSSSTVVTITPDTQPYNGKYMLDTVEDNFYYGKLTRNTYCMRSYMTYFEKTGGGTLVLSPGTYTLVKSVNVPSNVTIHLSTGTVVNKSWETGSKNLAYQNAMFFVVPPSVVDAVFQQQQSASMFKKYESTWTYPAAVKKYNGSQNVLFEGEGVTNSIIDLSKLFFTLGISVGHANGLTVRDIGFRNMDGNHFIEINSSKNVLVENCTFTDDYTTTKYNKGAYWNDWTHKVNDKECINIDACDPNYAGFSNPWAYHDYTPCNGIEIRNCVFKNFIRGVGSHKYTYNKKYTGNPTYAPKGQQVYNTKINIHDNYFEKAGANAIEAANWSNSEIHDNIFKNCHNSNMDNKNHIGEVNPGEKKKIKKKEAPKLDAMISLFGGKNINIHDNDISDCRVGIAVWNGINTGGGAEYPVTKYSLTSENIKNIKTKNNITDVDSGCKWFFADDLSEKQLKKYGYNIKKYKKKSVKPSDSKVRLAVAPNKTYHEVEYKLPWSTILKDYRKKYFNADSAVMSLDPTEATTAIEELLEPETTTEVTTEMPDSTEAIEATTEASTEESEIE